MPRNFHRLASAALTLSGTALFMLACSEQSTGPSDGFSSPRNNVVLPAAYIIDTGPGGTSSIGSSALFAKGSTTCSPQPACAGHFQFLAGKFTLARSANVQSLEAWLGAGVGGALDVHIKTDSAPPTGNHIPGHSLHAAEYSVSSQVYSWKVFTAFNVTLQPGTYWITLELDSGSTFNGGMTGPAASPLADYAFFADGNFRWVPFSAFNQNPGFGFRVYGESVLTPSNQIDDLTAYVSGSGLAKANVMKINGSLQKAKDALAANNTSSACTNLQAVVTYIDKQGPRKIAPSLASDLIAKTNAISTDVGC